uniref:Neurotransmitter-gated ion-channel ligand-binding domain-containing protein n=1 Tax=Romanomermis culicivorax TaxID=13658 RepID=A0A915JW23_ROMCU
MTEAQSQIKATEEDSSFPSNLYKLILKTIFLTMKNLQQNYYKIMTKCKWFDFFNLITSCYFVVTYCGVNGHNPYLRGVYIGTGESARILAQILQNYDPYVRPEPPGGGPTEMEIWMRILELRLHDGDFYFKGSFHRRWVDNRLKFDRKPGGREDITLDAGEFQPLIWQPDLVFMNHYSHNVMGRGFITIYHNGSVHHRNLDNAVIRLKKSIKNNRKSFKVELMGTDFDNDKNDVAYHCSPQGCLLKQDDDDRSKVKVENVEFSRTIQTIVDRDNEVLNVTLRLTHNS